MNVLQKMQIGMYCGWCMHHASDNSAITLIVHAAKNVQFESHLIPNRQDDWVFLYAKEYDTTIYNVLRTTDYNATGDIAGYSYLFTRTDKIAAKLRVLLYKLTPQLKLFTALLCSTVK